MQTKAETSSSGEPGSKNEDGKPEIGDQQTAGAASGESSAKSNPQDTSQRGAANTSQPDAAENSGESARNSESPSRPGAAGPPSLMSRMKDTLSSMMAKLNPQSGGQQSPSAGDPSQKGGQQGEEAAKAGEQSASQQGNSGEDKANAKESSGGQGDGQTAEKPGGRQGHSSSDSQQKGSDSQIGRRQTGWRQATARRRTTAGHGEVSRSARQALRQSHRRYERGNSFRKSAAENRILRTGRAATPAPAEKSIATKFPHATGTTSANTWSRFVRLPERSNASACPGSAAPTVRSSSPLSLRSWPLRKKPIAAPVLCLETNPGGSLPALWGRSVHAGQPVREQSP